MSRTSDPMMDKLKQIRREKSARRWADYLAGRYGRELQAMAREIESRRAGTGSARKQELGARRTSTREHRSSRGVARAPSRSRR